MINIMQTRFIHWKKQILPLLFWLLMPIIAVIALIHITNAIQEDSKVPVGLVIEEDTPLANELVASIKQTPFIRVYETTEEDAVLKLEQHKLDSAFIIKAGYGENVRKASRNRLITGYQSDLSFAYTPVSEMIISYVQQATGRSKAAHTVGALSDQYLPDAQWSWQEITSKSKEVEAKESLLHTTFSFSDSVNSDENTEVTALNTWGLWAVFSLLSTLLLFDWIIKENRTNLLPRFPFIRHSLKNYFIINAFFYTILLFLFDLIAAASFHFFLDEASAGNIWVLLSYRLMLSTGAFLLALCIKSVHLYYSVSFASTLFLGILSGAVIPADGLIQKFPWLEYVNPLAAFISGNNSSLSLALLLLILAVWYIRKEKFHASSP